MNELIKINYESDRPTVLARDLHGFLEVETPFHKWFPRMCEYGFTEDEDYRTFLSNRSDGLPGKSRQDAQLTIDMAKEICMLQRNEKGKQARQYFLQLEREWNSPEAVMSRALRMAEERLERFKAINANLSVQNAIMQPKAEYFDGLCDRESLTGVRETAKLLGMKQNDFVKWLIDHKYIYRDKRGRLMPYAEHVDSGLFTIKETYNDKTDWTGVQMLITVKGKERFMRAISS
jgi:anti-repressor protein